jgi:hypothetical protein
MKMLDCLLERHSERTGRGAFQSLSSVSIHGVKLLPRSFALKMREEKERDRERV